MPGRKRERQTVTRYSSLVTHFLFTIIYYSFLILNSYFLSFLNLSLWDYERNGIIGCLVASSRRCASWRLVPLITHSPELSFGLKLILWAYLWALPWVERRLARELHRLFLDFSFEGYRRLKRFEDEPTWRCQSNPLIRALGIQEPVIPGEPLIKG